MDRIERELFLSHGDVKVYHVYKNGLDDRAMDFWYCLESTEYIDSEFDIRELGYPDNLALSNDLPIATKRQLWIDDVKKFLTDRIEQGKQLSHD